MPTTRYATPLRLEPQASRRLALLFSVALIGAVILPWMVAAPGWSRPLALIVAGGVAGAAWDRTFGRRRIIRAVWDETGAWQLALADGTEAEAELAGESFVTPEAMILSFRAQDRVHHLVVLADTLDAETRRRLRVRLRLEGGKPRDDGP